MSQRKGAANKYCIPDARTYFKRINLDYPGLEKVKQAVQAQDWAKGTEEYLHWREEGENRPLWFFDAGEKQFSDTVRKKYADQLRQKIGTCAYYLRNEYRNPPHTHRLSDPPNYRVGDTSLLPTRITGT